MKIRSGFVSNSSSSSFCIYGAEIDFDIEEAAEKLGIEFDKDDFDEYVTLEEISSKLGLEIFTPYESYYLGRSWSSIEDNETGKDFKNSVKEAFDKLGLKEIELDTLEEAWFD